MINDEYQNAVEYLANEIVKRLNRNKKLTTDEQQSQITDDLDATSNGIARLSTCGYNAKHAERNLVIAWKVSPMIMWIWTMIQ